MYAQLNDLIRRNRFYIAISKPAMVRATMVQIRELRERLAKEEEKHCHGRK